MRQERIEVAAVRRLFGFLFLAWTALVLACGVYLTFDAKQDMRALALSQANAAFEKDILYRRWAASHGGVYVPVSERLQPNPYIKSPARDITVSGALTLTLVNPAYMTRQVQELDPERYGIKGHITSLAPLRPENAPDAWERGALLSLASSGAEAFHTLADKDGEQSLRLMRPLRVEQACLKCHADQGVGPGGIIGGISVNVPLARLQGTFDARARNSWTICLALYLTGAGGLFAGRRSLLRQTALRLDALADMEAAMGEARKANAAKSAFLASMSHEIRTPLNGIIGMLQLAQAVEVRPEQREYLTLGLDSAKKLLAILNDILDIAKIESGHFEIAARPFPLYTLVHAVTGLFREEVLRKNLRCDVTIDSAAPRVAVGDESRLRQILLNLVGNAVKYTESGGVEVSLSCLSHASGPERRRLLFVVADTGPGIADADLGRIFDPFIQLDSDQARKRGGVGLGLPIVKQLVARMGGTLCLDSEPGRGTTVYCAVEVGRHEDQSLDFPLPAPPHEDIREPFSVLLVDDDPVSRLFGLKFLGSMGHAVLAAENGEQALSLLATRHFDCILMDVRMPVMDGLETTRRIRADASGRFDPNIPIVAVTAHAMKGDRETFLKAGMDDYIAKPVEIGEFEAVLERLVAAKRDRESVRKKGEKTGGENPLSPKALA